MASYSVAEARDRFSALIEAAERGEAVEITRYGKPVAVLSSAERAKRQAPILTKKDVDELRAMRGSMSLPPGETWAQIIREIRDEEG